MRVNDTKCPACGVLLNESNLKRHLKKVHSDSIGCQLQNQEASSKKYNRVLYRCNQCGKKFGKSSTAIHLKDAHAFVTRDPENCYRYYFKETILEVSRSATNEQKKSKVNNSLAELKQASSDYKTLAREERSQGKTWAELEESLMHCGVCKRDLKRKNAPKHFRKVHHWNINKADKCAVEIKKSEEFVREESLTPSEYFNNIRVVSGGAYGLGKNRKH